eukprot:CAMPEP_0172313154 /NCGR_PEP_ID=MMETSP1058-20130122/19563_1 /TAXON_ID=83371 /ORGANISM="Detonula confervacea, Strain CCMP 353" /LENGTH=331 /DNA_ID=CAMNT_0013026763 /DNA_START=238 /DNA_END=1233 /DNA_ORIENTATION=-
MILLLMTSSSDAFSPPTIGCRGLASTHPAADTRSSPSSQLFRPSASVMLMLANNKSSDTTDTDTDNDDATIATTATLSEGLDRVFSAVDTDGSGDINLEEYNLHLSSAGYSEEAIQRSFLEMDRDGNGEISRDEFRSALFNLEELKEEGDDGECLMGYWINSVQQTCEPLGPIGRISQKIENLGPFKKVYKKITNLFGVDRQAIRKKGSSFVLAYSIISNLNGAVSLTVAWYMTVKRTGLSPLAPGQKKSLLRSYAILYGALQLLKPFRVAAAIAMSKLSAEYLDMTQDKFNCSRNVAIGCQYMMGQFMMGVTFFVGVSIVSLLTGVPIRG